MKKEICLLLLPLLLISGCGFGTDDTKSPQEGQIITRKTVQDAAKKDKAPEKTETPAAPNKVPYPNRNLLRKEMRQQQRGKDIIPTLNIRIT